MPVGNMSKTLPKNKEKMTKLDGYGGPIGRSVADLDLIQAFDREAEKKKAANVGEWHPTNNALFKFNESKA